MSERQDYDLAAFVVGEDEDTQGYIPVRKCWTNHTGDNDYMVNKNGIMTISTKGYKNHFGGFNKVALFYHPTKRIIGIYPITDGPVDCAYALTTYARGGTRALSLRGLLRTHKIRLKGPIKGNFEVIGFRATRHVRLPKEMIESA